MRSLLIAVVALGFAPFALSDANAANDRLTTTKPPPNYSTASSSSQRDESKYDRRCVIMSCGTPWCYNARR